MAKPEAKTVTIDCGTINIATSEKTAKLSLGVKTGESQKHAIILVYDLPEGEMVFGGFSLAEVVKKGLQEVSHGFDRKVIDGVSPEELPAVVLAEFTRTFNNEKAARSAETELSLAKKAMKKIGLPIDTMTPDQIMAKWEKVKALLAESD